MQTKDGKLFVIAGKSRSGKTAWTVKDIKKHRRICAWDPEDQWAELPGWIRVTSRLQLLDALQSSGAAKIAYVATGDMKLHFEHWAWCVYRWGRHYGECAAIAEELADVTSTGKAGGSWGSLVRTGLKRGITIYALSQRWAEADKTALGNPSFIVCCSMMPADVDYMARKIGIAPEELAALKPSETATSKTLPYIVFNVDSGEIERNRMIFKK